MADREQRNDADQRDGDARPADSSVPSRAGAESQAGGESPKKPSLLKSPRVRLVLILVAVVAIAGGILWFLHYQSTGRFMQTTDDAYIQADAVTVSSRVSGYVDKVFVADNQQVRAGQPLMQIDARDYKAQAAQYTAQIDVARANAQGVRAQINEQQAAVDRARAQLAAAQSDAGFAASEVARYAPLAASGAESGEKLSDLRNQARQARDTAISTQAALVSAQRRIGSLQAQVKQALSQGEAAQAQLSAANVNVGSTVVKANIDGRIGDKSVRIGQFLQPGTRAMSIVPVRTLYIEANFKETQLGLMRVGQPVHIAVDALSGVDIHGRVESVSPGTGSQFSLLPPQNATGNFTKIVQRVPVRIAIDAGPETLKLLLPGMSVDVTVDTGGAKGAKQQIEREQDAYNRNRK